MQTHSTLIIPSHHPAHPFSRRRAPPSRVRARARGLPIWPALWERVPVPVHRRVHFDVHVYMCTHMCCERQHCTHPIRNCVRSNESRAARVCCESTCFAPELGEFIKCGRRRRRRRRCHSGRGTACINCESTGCVRVHKRHQIS